MARGYHAGMFAAALIASSLCATVPPQSLVIERGLFAYAKADIDGGVCTVAGSLADRDHRLMLLQATTGLLWYPQVNPGQVPQLTPQQACFADARQECRNQGGTVCWVYFIPSFGNACLFGCTDSHGDCGDPPPIPPLPSPASQIDIELAYIAQEAASNVAEAMQ